MSPSGKRRTTSSSRGATRTRAGTKRGTQSANGRRGSGLQRGALAREETSLLSDDPGWYKDAIIYQLHVRAFRDSNGDGSGDFRGLATRLDYLQDLGVTAVWLLPFYPSPLRDDGYDTADYRNVHPNYGNLRDFRYFLKEAHRRGLRVITELVLNHTSDQHAWFQRARRAPKGSVEREWYVWSDDPDRYNLARVIFKDFEVSNWSWDPVAEQYFWHRFYSHQPDLNWDNPEVRAELFDIVDYWLEMGVDGLRLDAVPYLFEREGTNCENLAETHAALRDLRAHVDRHHEGKMLLAEANQWPEEAVDYFGAGDGDECHMAFHFPLMPRMYMALRMEDRFPIIDILQETPEIPATAQWATFLRNHDELTLEMVTDEERDYMWRVYAEDPQARINLGIRRRLAPLLRNNRRQIELLNGLLFSLPGTPIVYYGDEIGMGDNIYLGDRHGVRTPMQWSGDRNAGFSDANPQRLYLPVIIDPEYHAQAVNVEAQWQNPDSLLWWMKRLIAMRRRHPALSHGTLEFLPSDNRKVLSYLRCSEDEVILCVVNLSRFAQYAELDLSRWEGGTPVALLGHVEFPQIGQLPYLLTLGPHEFFWFRLEPAGEREARHPTRLIDAPTIDVRGTWHELLTGRQRGRLASVLPAYMTQRRWFRDKTRPVRGATIRDAIPVGEGNASRRAEQEPVGYIVIVEVEFADGDIETYVMPIAADPRRRVADETLPPTTIARLRTTEGEGVLYDALTDSRFTRALLETILRRRRLAGRGGTITANTTSALRRLRAGGDHDDPQPMALEQTNSTVAYGNRFVLKLFRRLEEQINPDVEIGRYLTEHRRFEGAPSLGASLDYERRGGDVRTLAVLHEYIGNEGDAWSFTLDALGRYFDEVRARPEPPPPVPTASLVTLALDHDLPQEAHGSIGAYLEHARLLGQRVAELHAQLAAGGDPGFEPEQVTALYRRSMYQSLRSGARRTFAFLRRNEQLLGEDAAAVLALEGEVLERYRGLLELELSDVRIRCHGDLHLGQVLWTGRDFQIIDFEGEPDRPVGERRIKRSALRDVAGLLRSFDYARHMALRQSLEVAESHEHAGRLESWALFWMRWVSATFLRAYLDAAGEGFLPRGREDLETLLEALVLEKALYEIGYEANNRPSFVSIPLQGLRELVG